MIECIIAAVQLAPDHPLVMVGDCVCLAETMRSSAGQEGSWRKCLTYGDREFKSMQAVVDTIKIQTKYELFWFGIELSLVISYHFNLSACVIVILYVITQENLELTPRIRPRKRAHIRMFFSHLAPGVP